MIINDSTEQVYNDLISLLVDVKLTQGPMGVNSTLRRHPSIKQFILQYQTEIISRLEKDVKL